LRFNIQNHRRQKFDCEWITLIEDRKKLFLIARYKNLYLFYIKKFPWNQHECVYTSRLLLTGFPLFNYI
jgi:hypothetical protein